MCGINGILRIDPEGPPIDREEVLRTREAMAARGPDGAGLWVSPTGEIALASRRLAILDLSAAGAQPMASADGRYHIVFNGEIYNFAELRVELEREGCQFASKSDTEVLLALYARRKGGMLRALRGMYAFAIWDADDRTLLLARDPYGIKPLYYSQSGGMFRFASQVKALERGGSIALDVSEAGLVGFLLWGCVPEPFTIRRSVRALPGGHFIVIEQGQARPPAPFFHFGGNDEPEGGDVDTALSETSRAHLVSDVPVALFLSGGMDSALVGALAMRHLREPPVSFTLTFDEFAGTPLDEGPMARRVADVLGTRHVERRVRGGEFRELWPEMMGAMDQPSIDGLNTFVVSRVAREAGLKVVLSGLGGDELFGGYGSFAAIPKLLRIGPLLRPARDLWPVLARVWSRHPKLAHVTRYADTLPSAYLLRRCLFLPEELPSALDPTVARDGLAQYEPIAELESLLRDYRSRSGDNGIDPWIAVHVLESLKYMRNQLLRDSDWASMANSLELRVPLVDTRLRATVAEHDFEPARSQGKRAMVRRIAPELPGDLFARRKSGFAMPVLQWVAGVPLHGRSSQWGWQSRVLALRVLREFGVECEETALPAGLRALAHVGPPRRRAKSMSVATSSGNGLDSDSRAVLLLLSNLQGAYGGIPSFNRALVQALAALGRSHRTRIRILALMDRPGDGDEPRIELDGLAYEAFGSNRVRFALRAIAEGWRSRTVIVGHVNFSPLALLSGTSQAYLVVYGVDAWRRFGALSRLSFRRFRRILAISAYTRDTMARLNGLRPERFVIVRTVLDPAHEQERRPLDRGGLNLPPGPMLLSVARLDRTERYKGIGDVIGSLPRILERWPDAFYVIAGDGDDRSDLEALAASTGVSPRVRFVGAVSDSVLTSYYRAADVFVLPSGKEGFGIVFLEAMYQGRPCVGGAAGGTPEVIAEGATGFLVTPGDRDALTGRLIQLLSDPDLRRRMGESGRGVVKSQYALTNLSQQLEGLLWR